MNQQQQQQPSPLNLGGGGGSNNITTAGTTQSHQHHLLGGRYKVIKLIGKGGFGIVEQCIDTMNENAYVAVKTIPSRYVNQESKRIVREIDVMLHLQNQHPHIMSFFDVFVTPTGASFSPSSSSAGGGGNGNVGHQAFVGGTEVHTDIYGCPVEPGTPIMQNEDRADSNDVGGGGAFYPDSHAHLSSLQRLVMYEQRMLQLVDGMNPQADFNLHIVMPLMKGDLHQFAKHIRNPMQQKLLTQDYVASVAVVFAFQTCFGLDYLHKCGIVHRDIKPDNILICLDVQNAYQSTAVIADFGLARDVHETETFYICTRHYRPPEVITNSSKGETSIDIWSLGCIFYELVTSRTLFQMPSALNSSGQWEGLKASQQLEVILNICGTPPKDDIQTYLSEGSNIQSYLLRSRNRASTLESNIRTYWKLAGTNPAHQEKWIDLIMQCLRFFPQQRPSAEELCRHPLFCEYNVFYGDNVLQFPATQYDPAPTAPTAARTENKRSVLQLLRRAMQRIERNDEEEMHECEAIAEGEEHEQQKQHHEEEEGGELILGSAGTDGHDDGGGGEADKKDKGIQRRTTTTARSDDVEVDGVSVGIATTDKAQSQPQQPMEAYQVEDHGGATHTRTAVNAANLRVSLPSVLHAPLHARYAHRSYETSEEVTAAIDDVLTDLEHYTHDKQRSEQLQQLLNFLVAVNPIAKSAVAGGPADDEDEDDEDCVVLQAGSGGDADY